MALFELTDLAAWVQSDLDTASATLARSSATAYLEAETGVRLTQQTGTVTYDVRWDEQWLTLPVPTISVSAVTIAGSATTDYKKVENRLYRRYGWGNYLADDSDTIIRRSADDYVAVAVTMTYGFATAPAEFKHWGLVLAAQVYNLAPKVGLQSLRIDDYSETYATGGNQPYAAMSLPGPVLDKLRARYGGSAGVVRTTQP